MSRFYHTYDLNSEVEKELLRASHLAQILIDEFDLFVISKALFRALDREINIEIIIISNTQNKSMKLVNLCKRLIDQEVSIFWKMDSELFTKEDYFAIFDKEYLICNAEQAEFEYPETLLRSKNDYFNGIAHSAQRINLLSGNIDIEFSVDKSIVFSKETITLEWETKNAHEVVIYPAEWSVSTQGVKTFQITEDTKFTIEGKNKDQSSRKSLFVRVIKENDIDIEVDVFDPIIKEFIAIQPASTGEGLYAAYLNQKIKLNWNIPMIGKFSESQMGKLPLVGSHEFELNENDTFLFTFKSINRTQTKKISFHCFHDESFFEEEVYAESESEKIVTEEASTPQNRRSIFINSCVKLFNIFIKKNN